MGTPAVTGPSAEQAQTHCQGSATLLWWEAGLSKSMETLVFPAPTGSNTSPSCLPFVPGPRGAAGAPPPLPRRRYRRAPVLAPQVSCCFAKISPERALPPPCGPGFMQ